MKSIFFTLCILLANYAHSEEILPEGCKAFPIKNELIIFPEHKPGVFMIHNLSDMDIWLTHAPMSLNSHIEKGHWSALSIDEHPLAFTCIESRPGHEQQVDCQSVVAVCQWPTATKPEKVIGTVWAGENMPLNALMAFVGRQGFELQTKNNL